MYSLEGVLQATALLLFALIVFLRILARKLTHKQGEMLYYPEMPPNARTVVPSPEEYGLTSERLVVEAPDGVRLRGYFIQGSHLSNITIVHFHGNAGNVGHRIPLAALFIEQLDVNVVLAEYRGYGLSDTPAHVTEDGIMQDAEAWLEHTALLPYVNPEGIVVHGSSLGGAVGVALASAHANKMAALMVENTFTSISAMTDTLFAQIVSHQPISLQRKAALTTLFLYLLKPLVLMLDWRSIDKMASLTYAAPCLPPHTPHSHIPHSHTPTHRCPVLFISGQDDELVPKEHMSTLYKQCGMQHPPPLAVTHCATHSRNHSLVLQEACTDPGRQTQRDVPPPADDGGDARVPHRICAPTRGKRAAQSVEHRRCQRRHGCRWRRPPAQHPPTRDGVKRGEWGEKPVSRR